MKLHRELLPDLHLVSAYDAKSISINGRAHSANVLLAPDKVIADWASGLTVDTLDDASVARICDLSPSVVLIGTGLRQRFPCPAQIRCLVEAGIGYEIMDTGSACRTYNILAAEGRKVVAALLLDSGV